MIFPPGKRTPASLQGSTQVRRFLVRQLKTHIRGFLTMMTISYDIFPKNTRWILP